MSILTGRMEWMLDTESKIFDGLTEAEFLAKSIKDVADHYGTGLFDQKTLDWMNLTQCLLIVYGGRLFAIRANPKIPKPKAAPNVYEAARAHAPQTNGASFHRTTPPSNDFSFASPKPENTVEIAGLGAVEFPDTDPRSPNYKPRFN